MTTQPRAGAKHISVYKRLETDEEFIKRVRAKVYDFPWSWDKTLDDEAWAKAKMQRRIVEDTTER